MSNKLSLKTEQVRVLSSSELDTVDGGAVKIPAALRKLSSAMPQWLQKLSSAFKPTATAKPVHQPAANPTWTATPTLHR